MNNNKLIFFIRRSSDFDHLSPLINICLENNFKKIKLYNSELNQSLANFKKDSRFLFLKKNGLLFYIVNPILIDKFKNKIKNIYLLNKFNRLIDIFIKIFFYIRFIKIIIFNVNSIFIIDHSITNNYKLLIRLKRLFKYKIVSFPHAIMMHSGHKVKEINEKLFKPNKFLNKIDKVVFYNENDSNLNYNSYNVKIMNSCLRYSDNWISSLSKIYKKINIEDKKIKILFLEEKNVDNINGELIEWINRKEINNIVKHTSNLDNVNLYIKSHPSKSKMDYENYNVKYLNNYSTFQCIDFCDIIICTISSAISDCFLLNKLIVNLDYCHNFNSLIKKFSKDICVNSFEDYKKRIKYLTTDNNYKRRIEYKEIKKNLLFEYPKKDYQTYVDLFNFEKI